MLFGSSGIRTPFNQQLLEISLQIGPALTEVASEVVIGRDTRTTSHLLLQSTSSSLLAAGIDVFNGGIAPSPSIAYSTRNVDVGLMVTASHNPEEFNGLKLFNPDGSSFTKHQQIEMEGRMQQKKWASSENQGAIFTFDAMGPHAAAILELVECTGPLRVVVDCGNGAGSVMTPSLLGQLGVTIIALNCNVSGKFASSPEPTPQAMPYIGEMVKKMGADCAIIHDGDADRMVAFDGEGCFIGGDHLLMLFAKYLDCKRVVTTTDASMAIESIAEVRRTSVGDTNVSEQLMEWGDFGGEPSGTWIFPDLSLCPDGIRAAALFCEIASEWDIVEEIDAMPKYTILRESIPHKRPFEVLMGLGATNPTDGIRVEMEDGWYLIRASGTESKIRITAEGENKDVAKRLLESARKLVKGSNTYDQGGQR